MFFPGEDPIRMHILKALRSGRIVGKNFLFTHFCSFEEEAELALVLCDPGGKQESDGNLTLCFGPKEKKKRKNPKKTQLGVVRAGD